MRNPKVWYAFSKNKKIGVAHMGKQAEYIARFKEAMGNYPTGVTVVTALDAIRSRWE